jgi:5,10-methylenetetrahydromethanopterin reductase
VNDSFEEEASMAAVMEFPELSCYLLPGHTTSPADAIDEARQAESLGLGKVWLSERFDVKDAGVICSAALSVTEKIHVATAATNLHTRHPMVLATMCSSLHYLSGGRFELGLARGVGIRNQLMGLETVTNRQMEEGLNILRSLWRGEKIMGHDGAMGNLPYLSMGDWLNAEIPIHFVGFGPRSLRFAGAHFDGVHLHTFITDEGLGRARALVQEGAEEAGRDPEAVKIYSVLATALNPDREDYLRKFVARMATYMQAPGYAEMLIALNGWDVGVLERFRANETVSSMPGGIDSVATLEQLEEISEFIPVDWLPAAAGSAEECATAWKSQLSHGADSVVIHGSTPTEFAPALEAYRTLCEG